MDRDLYLGAPSYSPRPVAKRAQTPSPTFVGEQVTIFCPRAPPLALTSTFFYPRNDAAIYARRKLHAVGRQKKVASFIPSFSCVASTRLCLTQGRLQHMQSLVPAHTIFGHWLWSRPRSPPCVVEHILLMRQRSRVICRSRETGKGLS